MECSNLPLKYKFYKLGDCQTILEHLGSTCCNEDMLQKSENLGVAWVTIASHTSLMEEIYMMNCVTNPQRRVESYLMLESIP